SCRQQAARNQRSAYVGRRPGCRHVRELRRGEPRRQSNCMKRILSLDGGGIGGVFSLQVLARIEEMFRAERSRPTLGRRDEFDCFAGTSTGAITAAGLAWGMAVADIERLWLDRGREIFAKAAWHHRWRGWYRTEPLAQLFRSYFCEDDAARTPAMLGT